jgi:hypothetical protein
VTTENTFRTKSGSTNSEKDSRGRLLDLMMNSPIPPDEILYNLGLYIPRQALSRILFINELYQKIIDVHGVTMEFGVRWGQNLSLFQSFRGIYEPYNYSRTIVGFDTFAGFSSTDTKDGAGKTVGDYSVSEGYERYLNEVLSIHESFSPIAHKRKFVTIKGDASQTIHSYLAENPHTIVALAYFDMDVYRPTKDCLEAIIPRLTKGSVIGFDELNCAEFPGETLAAMEVLGLNRWAIRRLPMDPLCSYVIVE